MAYTINIPAVGNDIADDIPKMKDNFNYTKTQLDFLALYYPNRGAISDLRIQTYGSTSVYYYCREAPLFTSGGYRSLVGPFSGTIDMSSSGAVDKLDAGSIAAATTYYLYLIYNSTTTTCKAVVSTSASAPTLPSGYTYYRLVSAFRTQASSAVTYGFNQKMNTVWYKKSNIIATGTLNLNWDNLDCSPLVPDLSDMVLIRAVTSSESAHIHVRPDEDASGDLLISVPTYGGYPQDLYVACLTSSSHILDLYSENVTATYWIYIGGYLLNI